MRIKTHKIIGVSAALLLAAAGTGFFALTRPDTVPAAPVAAEPIPETPPAALPETEPVLTEATEPEAPALPDALTRDGIRELLLNSTDYFNTVSGDFLYTFNDEDGDLVVLSLDCDIDASTAETHVMAAYPTNMQEVKAGAEPVYDPAEVPWSRTQIADGTECTLTDDLTGEVVRTSPVVKREQLTHDPLEKRFISHSDGTYSSYMRADPTNTYFARRILTPEELTFSLLCATEDWTITGTEEYAGRECVVVAGTAPDFYKEKNDVSTYTMYVDRQSGIVLKFVGMNDAQQITKFTYTQRVEIS